MPRGGSRGSAPSPTRSATTVQAPMRTAPTNSPPVQSQPTSGGGMLSGIGSTIVQGMAFGAGSEIAHQAVRSIIGGGSSSNTQTVVQQPVQNTYQAAPCQYENDQFTQCLKFNGDAINMCQSYFEALKKCQVPH